jgi:alpha(1,3/1,4) fucosyltransferase
MATRSDLHPHQASVPDLRHPTLSVSVIPPIPAFEKNALFEGRRQDRGSQSPNTHWMDCFSAVYSKGRELNMLFGTADVMPKEDADVLIYMAQPNSPTDAVAHKLKHPQQKSILVMWETSLGARYASNPKNHLGYDAIFTYINRLVDQKRYFFLPPRAYYRHRITAGLPFEQRRLGCLVGTNRKMRYRSGLFVMKKGWKFSFRDWIDYVFCPGELITFRSKVAKVCARHSASVFDIFGEGWEMLPETRHICLGIPRESTLNYVGRYRYYFALENHSSGCSLVSERVWDALWGDAVPVYLGHTGLDQFVPRECYIDARQFEGPNEMLDWLCRAPESIWTKYREAGREFIQSAAVERFLPAAFAEEFVRRVVSIAGECTRGLGIE